MSDKVHGGTPRGSISICLNCRSAHVIRGINFQSQIICRAGAHGFIVRFPIEECSIFDDKRIPALYQMQDIAWTIQSRNRGPIGFTDGGRTEITIEPPNRNSPIQGEPTGKKE